MIPAIILYYLTYIIPVKPANTLFKCPFSIYYLWHSNKLQNMEHKLYLKLYMGYHYGLKCPKIILKNVLKYNNSSTIRTPPNWNMTQLKYPNLTKKIIIEILFILEYIIILYIIRYTIYIKKNYSAFYDSWKQMYPTTLYLLQCNQYWGFPIMQSVQAKHLFLLEYITLSCFIILPLMKLTIILIQN